MSVRTLATVAVVAALALAGCGGLGGTATPTADSPTTAPTDAATATPTATPTATATPSPTATVAESTETVAAFPNGTNASTITDVGRLITTHRRALSDSDFVTEFGVTTIGDPQNVPGTVMRNYTLTARSSLDAQRLLLRSNRTYAASNQTRTLSRTQTLSTANMTYTRTVDQVGNVSYSSAEAVDPYAQRHVNASSVGLVSPLRLGIWNYTGTVVRGGETLLRYEAAGADIASANQTVTSSSGRVLVSAGGVVREATLRFTVVSDGGRQRTESYRFAVTPRANLTVEDPSWLDEARA